MDRKSIKEEAKVRIKGNLLKIWAPIFIIGLVSGFLIFALKLIFGVETTSYTTTFIGKQANVVVSSINPIYSLLTCLVSIVTTIASAAYLKYLLNFVRNGDANFSDVVECFKEKWLKIFLTSLLMGVIITLFSLLLIIPGIIMALSYAFAAFIVLDNDIEPNAALTKSRKMMMGYKWDYFVFGLSFIGWQLLAPFTLGLLYIWLVPYMLVAETLYYEKLKEISE